MRRFLVLLTVLSCLGFGAAGFSFYLKEPSSFWEGLIPVPEGEMRVVLVQPKTNARQIAQAFHEFHVASCQCSTML